MLYSLELLLTPSSYRQCQDDLHNNLKTPKDSTETKYTTNLETFKDKDWTNKLGTRTGDDTELTQRDTRQAYQRQ